MAATLQARRLTEAHRLAQARLGAQVVTAMRAIWRLLDPDNLDGSFDRWLSAALPVITAQHSTSARLAANYLATFKTLELGTAPAPPIALADTLDVRAATTSLLVTGPVHAKQAVASGVAVDRAMRTAATTAASSAMRHALDGGRSTIVRTVRDDRQALGWARATSGKACAFCAMLASRGPVYDDDSADFQAHDHCSCMAEPVYRQGDRAIWPPGSQRYSDLWRDAKVAEGDTVANFRRLVEAG